MDNVSYHKSVIVRKFLSKHPFIQIRCLPPYSPEYNPTEQVWKWLKKRVHDSKTINDGIKELLSRIRKVMYEHVNKTSIKPLKVGIGIWNNLYDVIFAV